MLALIEVIMYAYPAFVPTKLCLFFFRTMLVSGENSWCLVVT